MSNVERIQNDPAFQRLKSAVIGATGLAYYMDKDTAFAERVARRTSARPDTHLSDYLAILLSEGPGGPEFQALINELAVGETFFFRYAEQFEALRAVAIPECLRRNQGSRYLRLWSAGCSIGPEAYTLEILLKRYFAEELKDWQVSIIGTDINGAFIEQARRGTYGDWAMRGLPPDLLESCFDRKGSQWTVKPEYRSWTSFSVFNLVEGPLPNFQHGLGSLDIILCRNVMIYFDETTRQRLLQGLRGCLANGGWLVVGHAETGQQMSALYTSVPVPGATLYRKPDPLVRLDPAPRCAMPSAAPPPVRQRAADTTAPSPRRTAAPAVPAPPDIPPPDTPPTDGQDRVMSLEECHRLAERNRLDPVAHFRLGLMEEELGVGDAVAAFKRALYLDPSFALADYQLALAYWRRGRLGAAQRHFRNARDSLSGHGGDTTVAQGDGLTVAELRSMVDLWLSSEET
jgi:chemotaxis protein methyltransferase CheR